MFVIKRLLDTENDTRNKMWVWKDSIL